MVNRTYREFNDERLRIEIDVRMTAAQIEAVATWAVTDPGNPIAIEFLAIWLKGTQQDARHRADNFAHASDAWAHMFDSIYEQMKQRGSFSFRMHDAFYRDFGGGFGQQEPPRSKAGAPSGTQPWRSVLGIAGVNRDEISKAYRRLSMLNHQNSDTNQAAKEERQKTLNIAKDQAFREVLT